MKKIVFFVLLSISINSLGVAESPSQRITDLAPQFERLNTILDLLKEDNGIKDVFKCNLLIEAKLIQKTLTGYISEANELMLFFKKNNNEEKYQEVKKARAFFCDELFALEAKVKNALEK